MIYSGTYITAVNYVGNPEHGDHGQYLGYVLRGSDILLSRAFPTHDAAEEWADAEARAMERQDRGDGPQVVST